MHAATHIHSICTHEVHQDALFNGILWVGINGRVADVGCMLVYERIFTCACGHPNTVESVNAVDKRNGGTSKR